MPKSFHFDIEFKYPIDDVHRTLTDPRYWEVRLGDLYATSDIDVADGSIQVSVSEEIDSASLPSLVAKVAPSRLGLTRVDHWGPLSDGKAAGSVTGIAHGLPIRIETTLDLTAAESRTRLAVDGTAEVKMPIIGGQIEKLLKKTVEDLLGRDRDAVESFLA
ncbi:DUF2505 domain-containing protein [Rhodococcus erythropolis]|jgi:hypothetical protein|uniref:DUF2505 domain-containing protein n=1 Tax=Rhodococcus TaxID=1827 RepID=UPI000BB2DCC3|nr:MULTISPECIES: DUF2505 domain-containing protein [Rhodococcus]NHP18195.1 DUF2505 domain-containing protein [Rhodococcus sp. IC4_135]PBI96796.1 hypothetical protein BKP42_34540 [Rhodococcus erythropolis]RQO47948.1 DUF2505 domain-containing protein [Rhodococcus sp. KBW08]UJC79909.1 DUF2505 domain-containing protein [Rhodococcus erythropolis]